MPTDASYEKCLETLFGLHRFGIKLGLEVIGRILEGLGNPQRGFRAIHLAGTNGKGSVGSTLAQILRCAGYRVGLYTSPHLIRFNERILIDGRPISNEAVVEAYETVKAVHSGDRQPTFFEFATAMAFHAFRRAGVEWAVIETGMGGRLDATNILEPEVTVITNISLEHREYLGNTVARIAFEKAGILKHGVPLVTGVRQKSAIAEIFRCAKAVEAPVFRYQDAFHTRRNRSGGFTYHGMDHTWTDLRTRLVGDFQVENTALALAAAELLIQGKTRITESHIREGIATTRWPGRLEKVLEKPVLILDGAHNLAAARVLGQHMEKHLDGKPITLVVGILDDKPFRQMLGYLLPQCRRVIVTRPRTGRALPAETLFRVVQEADIPATLQPNVPDAVKYALATTPEEAAVIVAGSLYVVGEARAYLIENGMLSE